MIQSVSAGHAKAYYSDALLKSDYYLNDQEMGGAFRGKLAARLGIEGAATKEVFFALCENRHPLTGEPLTLRTKSQRTTGYDINFHCPKSVSIIHVLSKDDHILKAFQESVNQTMTDIEAAVQARVRKNGKSADRDTGELAWVDFIHQTARPVDGSEPDPHLHAHCYAFNATFDKEEHCYKAAKFREIKKQMPYYQALFHKRFSDELISLGYNIRPTKNSFEIVGVPQPVIELFSKRTDAIGKAAKEKGITDAKELSELGARTRAKKQKGLTMEELKAGWRSQIWELEGRKESGTKNHDDNSPDKIHSVPVRYAPEVTAPDKADAARCADYAIEHHFERASVVSREQLLATSLKFSLGNGDVSAQAILEKLQTDDRLIRVTEHGRQLCTTKEVLKEEKRMVSLARQGQGALQPLYHETPALALTGQQKAAAEHVLTTADRVSIIRGAAGAGKTTLMRETVSLIQASGSEVTVLAPTSQASRDVLRREGFREAETLALFLVSQKMQEAAKGQVIWLDEAGLTGTQDMRRLLEIAAEKNARVVLGGDTRQHASVVRGDALRILNTVGGIKTAEVNKIYRQKDAAYRDAVSQLADGNIKSGFDKLDAIGFIKTGKGSEDLVNAYMEVLNAGKTGLVISPTHKHGEEITAAIRKRMQAEGMLGKKEIQAEKLKNRNLTEAQKSDRRNYEAGNFIQFNQNATGFQRGSLWRVKQVETNKVIIADRDGRTAALPEGREKRFDVFEHQQIGIAKGDKIRVTRTIFDKDNHRLNNGQVFEVDSVRKDGIIRLSNAISKQVYTLGSDTGHIDHAHCITSYAAQGKTVDEVFIAQPAETFGATDARQFYVSVSRARDKATIYTDDKEVLLSHAAKAGDRQSAMELTGGTKHLEHLMQQQIEKDMDADRQHRLDKNDRQPGIEKEWDYEPGF